MIKQEKSKSGAFLALVAVVVVLALVILLENLSAIVPSVPKVLQPTSQLFTVLKKGAVYSLVAVSMNLLNGFTGLFSLGQAGFMLLGAYTYAILTVPVADKDTVYYLFGGSAVKFSLPDAFGAIFGTTGAGGAVSMVLGVLVALILAGVVAAFFAWLIGLPVLRLKSDYLAIATLGFAEIIRAIFQWQKLGRVTNGANMLTNFPTIRKAVKKMATIDKMTTDGTFDNFSKREKLQIARQRAKLEKNLGSIADLTRLPAALFVVDVQKEANAVKEAKRLSIPVFAMVDTCCDPTDIDYVIPANDDATKSIAVVLEAMCAAIAEGTEERKLEKEKEAQEAEAEGAAIKKEGKPRIKKAVKASVDAEEAAVAEVVAAVETPFEEPAAAPAEEAAEAVAEEKAE